MSILILFATTEGQTRKIAQNAAAHLTGRGQSVTLISAADAQDLPLDRYDRAILMASVHAGRYQPEFLAFVAANKTSLNLMPTAFCSVSLSAASDDPEDIEGVEACLDKMRAETGWTPGAVRHVAGAFRFSKYDFLKSWAMRWIASKKGPDAVGGGDTEYTDWDALYRFLDAWTEGKAS